MSTSKPRLKLSCPRTATKRDGGLAAGADSRREALRAVLKRGSAGCTTRRHALARAYEDGARYVVRKLVAGDKRRRNVGHRGRVGDGGERGSKDESDLHRRRLKECRVGVERAEVKIC